MHAQLFHKTHILDIGETAEFYISFESFINGITFLIAHKQIDTSERICLTVEELSGKHFYLKLPHTLNDYLLWDRGEKCLLPVIPPQ
jgi:hypothetical protein